MLSLILLQTFAMVITALLLPGLRVTSILGPVLAVLAIAGVNVYFWSASLFFQVPLELSGNTLLLLAVNGAIFWVIIKFVPGIEISGILAPLLAPIIFTLSAMVIQIYQPNLESFSTQMIERMLLFRDEMLKQQHDSDAPESGALSE